MRNSHTHTHTQVGLNTFNRDKAACLVTIRKRSHPPVSFDTAIRCIACCLTFNGLNDSASPILPELDNQCASTFFEEKIQTIWTGLETEGNYSQHQPSYFVGETMSEFSPVSEDQLAKIISKCKPTSQSVDPIPTKTVLDCLVGLLPVLAIIINSSLHSAITPDVILCG